jgi:hypothetical protein
MSYVCTYTVTYSRCRNEELLVRFEVFAVVKMSVLVSWVVTLCGLVGRYQRFRETYCLHLQGWSAEDGDVSLKFLYLPTSPRSVTTQETNINRNIVICTCCLVSVARVVKSGRMRWAVRVVRMGETGVHIKFWLGNIHLKDQGDRWVTLNWFFERQDVRMGGGWNWLKIVSCGGLWY